MTPASPAPGAALPPPAPVRRGRLRTWLRRLGLLLMSLLIFGGLLELGVLLIFGEQPKFPRYVVEGPYGVRINVPGAHYRHKSADGTWYFHINQQGMRAEREYPLAKPAGVTRIVSFGDSYTVGLEVDAEQTFSAVLERELNAAGHPTEVLNAGVSGYSNAEACIRLEREFLAYHPDVVVLSFYINDLVDNVRAGLFAYDGEKLVPKAASYVPAGDLGNFLNTSWFFNLLSARSNAFTLLKEQATQLLKSGQTQENIVNLRQDAGRAAPATGDAAGAKGARRGEYQGRLCAAIIDRMYQLCRDNGAALIVQSIPYFDLATGAMQDMLPYEYLDAGRPGFFLLPMQPLLEPHKDQDLLYRRRSQQHWTELAHELSGKALAGIVEQNGLFAR